jgi:tetratricopeptide (TPR) repeat protein
MPDPADVARSQITTASSLEKPPYRPTFGDRHGPDVGNLLRAFGYGVLIFGVTAGALTLELGHQGLSIIEVGIVAGCLGGGAGWLFSAAVGRTWQHLFVDGSSTPYAEQYSLQQAMVMQGRVDEALRSFEQVIENEPDAISPRLKAAELYAAERKDYERAAELFRSVLRIPTITIGDNAYATNRLVDLLIGPLQNQGRAVVVLRRFIERYPASPAAAHARRSLADIKARLRSGPNEAARGP